MIRPLVILEASKECVEAIDGLMKGWSEKDAAVAGSEDQPLKKSSFEFRV